MNIFESLENLNVSEECFDDIMGIVEGVIMNAWNSGKPNAGKLHSKALENKQNELKDRYNRKFSEICKKRKLNLQPQSKEEAKALEEVSKEAQEQTGVKLNGTRISSNRPTKNDKGEFKTYKRQQIKKEKEAMARGSVLTGGSEFYG